MITYLQDFVQSVSQLPAELQRNFKLMKELDERTQALQREIDDLVQRRADASTEDGMPPGKKARTDPDLDAQIDTNTQQCVTIADEKVALAVQTYDLVDGHIRKLDKDLRLFEEELKRGDAAGGEGGSLDGGNGGGWGTAEKGGKKKRGAPPGGMGGGGGGGPGGGSGNPPPASRLQVDLDLPVDPNEPTYCICNRVSFGEMIACDNPDCKVEWFHFECVGLSKDTRTKGKWFCNDCSSGKKRGRPPR